MQSGALRNGDVLVLSVRLFVCLSSKTKQFRAIVSIDDRQEVLHGLFKEPILGPLRWLYRQQTSPRTTLMAARAYRFVPIGMIALLQISVIGINVVKVCHNGRRRWSAAVRGLTMDADQKSSIVVPSATVVPLTSMIQNRADKSGRARISQRRRTLRSPGRAVVVGHVTTGASSDSQDAISTTMNSLSRAVR